MDKLKKIYLHVGGDKTGSTTIQKILNANRELLSAGSVLYPEGVHHAKLIANFSNNPMELDHFRFRKARYESVNIKYLVSRYLSALEDQLQEKKYEYLIISYEGTLGLSESELKAMKLYLSQYCSDIEVVYYLRPHLSYAASAMSQRVRFGSLSWSQHPPVTHYLPRLNKLENTFGRDALNLKVFDRASLKGGDVIDDFFSALNLPEKLQAALILDNTSANSSLSEEAILIGDALVNRLSLVNGPVGGDFNNLFCETLESIKGRKLRLSDLQLDVIRRATAPDVAAVKKAFGLDLGRGYIEACETPALSPETTDSIAALIIGKILPDRPYLESVPITKAREKIVRKARGHLEFLGEPSYDTDGYFSIVVVLHNNSNYWWGGRIAPVCLSYHWFDRNGKMVEFEGERTLLPMGGVPAGESLHTNLKFLLPPSDGDYILEATLIQEFYKWFERIGFKAARLPIGVRNGVLLANEP